jgi:hypothetical protein
MLQQLVTLSNIWCEARALSAARLGTIVAGNSKFFDQIAGPSGNCTVATFQKFLSFFRDPASWPDACIPPRAVELLDNFASIATDATASAGKIASESPSVEEAA